MKRRRSATRKWRRPVVSALVLLLSLAALPAGKTEAAVAINLTTRGVQTWTDGAGFWHVTGEVVNVGTLRVALPEIDATYYNASNLVIGTGFAVANVGSLAPGSSSAFDLIENSEPAGFRPPGPEGCRILEQRRTVRPARDHAGRAVCGCAWRATLPRRAA